MRDIEELSDEECQLEDRRTKVKDFKEHSLTTEERDEIIRKYNDDFLGESSRDTREIQETKECEVKIWKPQIEDTPVEPRESIVKPADFHVKLQEILTKFPFLNESSNHNLRYADAYFRITTRRDEGSIQKKEGDESIFTELSNEFDIPLSTIRNWYKNRSKPMLLREFENHEFLETKNNNLLDYFDSIRVDNSYTSRFNQTIECHPSVIDNPHFKIQYHRAITYLEIMREIETSMLPSIGNENLFNELADRYDVPSETVKGWYTGRCKTRLVSKIERLQTKCNSDRLQNHQPRDNVQVSNHQDIYRLLEEIHQDESIAKRIHISQIRDSSLISKLDDSIDDIVDDFNQKYRHQGNEFKAAVVDNRLFIRIQDTSQENWLNIHANHHFHFKTYSIKRDLVNKSKQMLGVNSTRELSTLILKLCKFSGRVDKNTECASDLKRNLPYLTGETFHFILDTIDETLDDETDNISKITGTGRVSHGISNPKFPKISTIRSRFTPIMNSDGHLSRGGASYYEKELARFERVKGYFDIFGEVDMWEKHYSDRASQLRIPKVMSDVLTHIGMIRGSKVSVNEGLVAEIFNSSIEEICDFFSQLMAEDGNFSGNSSTWTRDVRISGPHLEKFKILIKNIGRSKSFQPDDENPRSYDYHLLSWGELKKRARTGNFIATELMELIQTNRSNLLDDEIRLIRKIGVRMIPEVRIVKWNHCTDTITVTWVARNASYKDTIKLILLAPPDHPRKLNYVEKYLSKRLNKVREVIEEMKDLGLQPNQIWKF